MSSTLSSAEKQTLLVFIDITGYTAYVRKHKTNWAHGQYVISTLMEGILREVRLPLVLAKLEGDAAFLYAVADGVLDKEMLNQSLRTFFILFRQKLDELLSVNACHCPCCDHIGELSLKIIVHSGSALFYEISGHKELSGPDVILLHRLSKNGVKIPSYLLLTKEAHDFLGVGEDQKFVRSSEAYPEFGPVETYVEDVSAITRPILKTKGSLIRRIASNMKKMLYSMGLMLGMKTHWFREKYHS